LTRQSRVERKSRETQLAAEVDLDGKGRVEVETGLPFLDHMVEQIARYGAFDLTFKGRGDVAVDPHHLCEDAGIVIGQALSEALGSREGITRFAAAYAPLDESLARVVVAARANGLQPIDGPYAQVRDTEGLRTFAKRAAMLGFDGKWALNPVQVDVLNEVFSPRQEDYDKAVAILEAYRSATDVEQTGAVMLGEEMIDEASRKMAAVMVERGESFGMKARPWVPSSAAR